MRVFAALNLPDWLGAELAGQLPPVPDGVRAIPSQRWHLTLAFYGEVEGPGLDCLGQQLAKGLAADASGAQLGDGAACLVDGGGSFASGVGYLAVRGIDADADARLRRLAAVTRAAGRACRAPGTRERERFRAHITVARAKRHARIPAVYVQRLRGIGSTHWLATTVDLVASFPGPEPRYQVLRSVALVG